MIYSISIAACKTNFNYSISGVFTELISYLPLVILASDVSPDVAQELGPGRRAGVCPAAAAAWRGGGTAARAPTGALWVRVFA